MSTDPATLAAQVAALVSIAWASRARRTLDRYWWLRATADVVLEAADERRSLLRLAARHISATHALRPTERNAAIRLLFAKAVPIA